MYSFGLILLLQFN